MSLTGFVSWLCGLLSCWLVASMSTSTPTAHGDGFQNEVCPTWQDLEESYVLKPPCKLCGRLTVNARQRWANVAE